MEVNEIETKKEGAVIKNMQFSGNDSIEISLPPEIDNNLDGIIKFIAGRSPRDLELLASVHFWAIKQQRVLDEYSADYIFEKLSELKPDAGFSEGDVKSAIETLETSGLLKN